MKERIERNLKEAQGARRRAAVNPLYRHLRRQKFLGVKCGKVEEVPVVCEIEFCSDLPPLCAYLRCPASINKLA